jgi:hypothetical protein
MTFLIHGKIKNVPNHQPDIYLGASRVMGHPQTGGLKKWKILKLNG